VRNGLTKFRRRAIQSIPFHVFDFGPGKMFCPQKFTCKIGCAKLLDCGRNFQSGVGLRFPPQSKKVWLRLCRGMFWRLRVKPFPVSRVKKNGLLVVFVGKRAFSTVFPAPEVISGCPEVIGGHPQVIRGVASVAPGHAQAGAGILQVIPALPEVVGEVHRPAPGSAVIQITVPCGTMPLLGMITMPSRM
jgi:hypothetical protein